MTNKTLARRAFHVEFEVEMLVKQIEYYIDTYAPTFPSGSSTQPEEQALLEAILVHLRLLDEFLECRGWHNDDVKACDWPGWSKGGFLNEATRKRINAHVAHMSARRRTKHGLGSAQTRKGRVYAARQFFDSIPAARLKAFGNAPAVAARGRKRFYDELKK